MSELAKKIIEEVCNMTSNLPKDEQGVQEAMGDAERVVDVLLISRAPDPSLALMKSRGTIDVLVERQRQIDAEGWTAEHDSQWTHDEIPMAAVCYCLGKTSAIARAWWPWDWEWWKPKNRRRDLIRAAALLIAEIDRLDRIAAEGPAEPPAGAREPGVKA